MHPDQIQPIDDARRDAVNKTWYVVPDYSPEGRIASSAIVVDRAGQQVAHFEWIEDAERCVEAVNREK